MKAGSRPFEPPGGSRGRACNTLKCIGWRRCHLRSPQTRLQEISILMAAPFLSGAFQEQAQRSAGFNFWRISPEAQAPEVLFFLARAPCGSTRAVYLGQKAPRYSDEKNVLDFQRTSPPLRRRTLERKGALLPQSAISPSSSSSSPSGGQKTFVKAVKEQRLSEVFILRGDLSNACCQKLARSSSFPWPVEHQRRQRWNRLKPSPRVSLLAREL